MFHQSSTSPSPSSVCPSLPSPFPELGGLGFCAASQSSWGPGELCAQPGSQRGGQTRGGQLAPEKPSRAEQGLRARLHSLYGAVRWHVSSPFSPASHHHEADSVTLPCFFAGAPLDEPSLRAETGSSLLGLGAWTVPSKRPPTLST